jgi:hypothetical protein
MLKKFSQCIGLASLILAMNYGDLLGGGYDVRMHVPFALNGIVSAQLADILLLGLLLFAVIGPLSRTRFYPWVRLALVILVPPYLAGRVRVVLPFRLDDSVLILIAVVWAGIVVVLLVRARSWYERLMRVGDFAGVFLAIFAFCSMVQLLYVLRWKPGAHEQRAVWTGAGQPPRVHPLVVWVVFDELSYDQVYEHRARDLTLPNFDALRGESTVYSDVQPIGEKTVKVLPSLLSGHAVRAYRFSFGNRLRVHDADTRGFHLLDGAGTVFGDAKREGWRTATVGWYNPYCTIYGDAIDNCYWMNRDMTDGPMAQGESFWRNVAAPLKQVAEQLVAPEQARRDLCSYDVRQRYQTYIDLEQHTSQVLQGDQADFVFLHLPVPHSPNIWSRAKGEYTQRCGSSYLDNLALADRELGNVMRILQGSPRWKDTTLIVEGDHSWRSYIWDDQPAWSDEDEEASRAGFDARPAMIVHRAGQTQGQVIATPWSLLNVHEVVEQVLRGEAVSF